MKIIAITRNPERELPEDGAGKDVDAVAEPVAAAEQVTNEEGEQ